MTETAPLAVATFPVVRAMIEYVQSKDYSSGVLGVRAQPRWDGPAEIGHQGQPVRIAPCRSTLEVREALQERGDGAWLVVLTDREPTDLGDGILAHFIGNRLRHPDEWAALRQGFQATGIDPALQEGARAQEIASALLAITPEGGWPPAPGGILAQQHAYAAVARRRLGFEAQDVDAGSVLAWSRKPNAAGRIADLRDAGGDALTDAVLGWLSGQAGLAARPLTALLRNGRVGDALPLGLVVDLLTRPNLGEEDAQTAREALIRLEPAIGGPPAPALRELRAWADEAVRAFLEADLDRTKILARADELLANVQAMALAEHSALLTSALRQRLSRFCEAARRAALVATDRPVDGALVGERDLAAALAAWSSVAEHRLADPAGAQLPYLGAARLLRWLGGPSSAGNAIGELVARHRDHDAWVDNAVKDVAGGVDEQADAEALETLLELVRRRRDEHDRQFALALSALTRDDPREPAVSYVEDVLAASVVPLARSADGGVLLLVLDGMSVGVAAEMIQDALDRGWHEMVPARQARRGTALAVLPTLTRYSRASLLSGGLAEGEQAVEVRGFEAFARANQLGRASLFHKKLLDSARPGQSVFDDVGLAIDDTSQRLLACVLNAVDDSLDRSDPGGTTWTLDAIKHLRPLLDRARSADRVVVVTADHGHIIERRQGVQRRYPDTSSARSRAATGTPGEGEILMEGRRVLAHNGRAILAVDERLRYGPLKAGYHGGASAAEAIVPVCFLVPGDAEPPGLDSARSQEPPWWEAVIPPAVPAERAPSQQQDALPGFELTASAAVPLAHQVLGSAVYLAQSRLAGRAQPASDRMSALMAALVTAPGHRLSEVEAADLLGVRRSSARGAIATVQRVLNVEGYPVLSIDADGSTLVLDEILLREQFGIGR
jgi:hypothetical protein